VFLRGVEKTNLERTGTSHRRTISKLKTRTWKALQYVVLELERGLYELTTFHKIGEFIGSGSDHTYRYDFTYPTELKVTIDRV